MQFERRITDEAASKIRWADVCALTFEDTAFEQLQIGDTFKTSSNVHNQMLFEVDGFVRYTHCNDIKIILRKIAILPWN